jgi:Aspartyl protease
LTPGRGLIIVPAELWGPTGSIVLRLALDTGATNTLVNIGLLVALGYDPALATERIQITTGGGVEFAPRLTLSKIAALGHERNDFPVLGHTRVTPCHPVRVSMAFWVWTSFAARA